MRFNLRAAIGTPCRVNPRDQCLNRRIPDLCVLTEQVAHWREQRHASGARINWMFNVDHARKKLGRAYPDHHAIRAAKAA